MHGSILSAMKQFLTPDVITKMASASGVLDPAAAERVVGGAVPAILSALANLVAKPGGARHLGDAIAQQSPRTLENFATTLGSSASLADSGRSILSDLLGGSALSALAGAISKFAGVGDGATRSLLGMLAPAVLGILGREQAQAGTGTSGLAQMLTAQKDQFAAAVPQGLSSLLETSGFLDRVDVASSTARARDAGQRGQERVSALPHAMSSSAGSSRNWMYWVLPLLAFGALFWYLLPSSDPTRQTAQLPPPPMAPSPGQKLVVGGVDVQQQVASAINSLQTSLQEVKDAASAGASLPKLERAADELDRLNKLAQQLPSEGRQTLAQQIGAITTNLNAKLDDVVAMPEVAPKLRPVVENLRTKIETLAMARSALAQQSSAPGTERKVIYIAKAPSDAVLVSIYFNRSVYNQEGERLGSVNDLLVRPDGSIAATVIGVGGFLGIGEKEIAVPFAIARVARRDDSWHLVIDASKDALQNAPSFEATGERVRLIVPKQ